MKNLEGKRGAGQDKCFGVMVPGNGEGRRVQEEYMRGRRKTLWCTSSQLIGASTRRERERLAWIMSIGCHIVFTGSEEKGEGKREGGRNKGKKNSARTVSKKERVFCRGENEWWLTKGAQKATDWYGILGCGKRPRLCEDEGNGGGKKATG